MSILNVIKLKYSVYLTVKHNYNNAYRNSDAYLTDVLDIVGHFNLVLTQTGGFWWDNVNLATAQS